jgi:Tfp pilus assembly PilM family ATPase
MVKEARIAAFVGNEMHYLQTGENSHEAVLALPLNRLLVKMVKVPADAEAVEFCTSVLQEINPFPDEPLSVSCETVRETDEGSVVIAAALPEGSTDDIAETSSSKAKPSA